MQAGSRRGRPFPSHFQSAKQVAILLIQVVAHAARRGKIRSRSRKREWCSLLWGTRQVAAAAVYAPVCIYIFVSLGLEVCDTARVQIVQVCNVDTTLQLGCGRTGTLYCCRQLNVRSCADIQYNAVTTFMSQGVSTVLLYCCTTVVLSNGTDGNLSLFPSARTHLIYRLPLYGLARRGMWKRP